MAEQKESDGIEITFEDLPIVGDVDVEFGEAVADDGGSGGGSDNETVGVGQPQVAGDNQPAERRPVASLAELQLSNSRQGSMQDLALARRSSALSKNNLSASGRDGGGQMEPSPKIGRSGSLTLLTSDDARSPNYSMSGSQQQQALPPMGPKRASFRDSDPVLSPPLKPTPTASSDQPLALVGSTEDTYQPSDTLPQSQVAERKAKDTVLFPKESVRPSSAATRRDPYGQVTGSAQPGMRQAEAAVAAGGLGDHEMEEVQLEGLDLNADSLDNSLENASNNDLGTDDHDTALAAVSTAPKSGKPSDRYLVGDSSEGRAGNAALLRSESYTDEEESDRRAASKRGGESSKPPRRAHFDLAMDEIELTPLPAVEEDSRPGTASSNRIPRPGTTGGDENSDEDEDDEKKEVCSWPKMIAMIVIFLLGAILIIVGAIVFRGGNGDKASGVRYTLAPVTPAPFNPNITAVPGSVATATPPTQASTPAPTLSPPSPPVFGLSDARWTPPCPGYVLPVNLTNSSQRPNAQPSTVKDSLRSRTEMLLGYGTRVAGSGSSGWLHTAAMLRTMSTCDQYWYVYTDDFTDAVYNRGNFMGYKNFSNIVATFQKGNISNGHIVLSAHFDSKLFTNFEFLGASDSAVPCIMILELMNRLSSLAFNNPSFPLPLVTVMFFDGEEAFYSWEGTDNTYGSRHLANLWKSIGRSKTITQFVLLDLIAQANPTFHNYFPSMTGQTYERLRTVHNTLLQLDGKPSRGTFPYEPNGYGGVVEDDHLPWLAQGVPVLHLIPLPFPVQWHDASDNAASVDYDTVYYLVEALWATLF
jgi:glutaminyl-peptide cyclotransferase